MPDKNESDPIPQSTDQLQLRRFIKRRNLISGALGLAAYLAFDQVNNYQGTVHPIRQTASPGQTYQNPTLQNLGNLEPIPTPLPKTEQAPVSQVKINPTETSQGEASFPSLLNRVLHFDLDSEARIKAERSLASFAKSRLEIDQALWVVTNPYIRTDLIEKRFTLRTSGTEVLLTQIPPDKISWCEDQGIYPETLGICLDAFPKANKIINTLLTQDRLKVQLISNLTLQINTESKPQIKGKLEQQIDQIKISMFRPDLLFRQSRGQIPSNFFQNLNAWLLMINPGGLARLICTETGGTSIQYKKAPRGTVRTQVGFSNIADIPAIYQINSEVFPTAKRSLEQIAEYLQKLTGLPYTTESIPGSPRLDPTDNVSGGAISIQIMPDNVISLLNLLSNSKLNSTDSERYLNIFDLTDATVLAWIFLARGIYLGKDHQGYEHYRSGYLRGTYPQTIKTNSGKQEIIDWGDKLRRWAVEKWNPHPKQRDLILGSANDYYQKFPN